ncbi:hypothetical protein TMES_19380 [Thalassospira mesophila]|uniref:34 kDa membrane antigen n=2 Tax=Thalassospira mesophila TaxID=1293891 RepID=A0A1Y2KWG5_9PROT|nr:hypothetical protein TMES_19380 [Thalassospira mesophila]
MRRTIVASAVMLAGTFGFIVSASAGEQPAGELLNKNGMHILGVFLQPVVMEPAMPGQEADKTDIHLEADIAALPTNANGFYEDAWIPYLDVDYQLERTGSDWHQAGKLMAMVASDGPHYGANVKLDGPGEYHVTFHINPPEGGHFMHHVDKETGVAPWWQPFDYDGTFIFAGAGKKGGY